MRSDLNQPPIIKNKVLTSLALSDFAYLRTFLRPVVLVEGSVLHEQNKPIEQLHFVESGLVSLMTLGSKSVLETAMVGCHGAVGASIVLGTKVSMHKAVVSIPGRALAISVGDLQRAINKRPQIRERLLHYVESLMVHGSQTALCGVRHELERRLACWICLACDAAGAETLPITHEYLSFILGLRRAGVTEALTRFEELGLVRKMRGVLRVQDRAALERRACCCYDVITAAYGPPKPRISISRGGIDVSAGYAHGGCGGDGHSR